MLLAIDIGNTNIVLGVFQFSQGRPKKTPAASWRLSTLPRGTADDYAAPLLTLMRNAGLDPSLVRGVCIASVVPSLDFSFQKLSEKYFGLHPLMVGPDTLTGIKILYDNPAEVGADRIVNAVAAYDRVRGSCIVVDFGTATTFDCIGRKGEYLGGAIAPGPFMAAEALTQKTAKLPQMGVFQKPRQAIGRTTINSLRSGLYHGYIGLTEGILQQLIKEMGTRPRVLATGGLAGLLSPAVPLIKEVHPDLTLEGLRLIWTNHQHS